MTRAELKAIDTADWDSSYKIYLETGLFACYFQASIGPAGSPGAELFGFTACNPHWLESMIGEDGHIPNHIVVCDVSVEAVERAAELLCDAQPPGDWDDVARKLAKVTDWEFKGYVP